MGKRQRRVPSQPLTPAQEEFARLVRERAKELAGDNPSFEAMERALMTALEEVERALSEAAKRGSGGG